MDQSKDSFTCITCRVAFKDAEIQRAHYKTDWHRYNLKRKVAELPPVTTEEFQRRVFNQRNAEEILKEDTSVYCKVCRKSFGNTNAFQNHLNSKKHKENANKFDNESDIVEKSNRNSQSNDGESVDDIIEEVDSDEWDEDIENPMDNNFCLFCPKQSSNFMSNLDHMTVEHSFFIPDVDYCTDVMGLLSYLGEKVSQGYMCLWCNEKGRTFHSMEAAQKHMVDKGHCKMIHEGVALAEYADYYDYSSSYPDADENPDPDQEIDDVEVLDGTDYQLVLPSGITVGHRSLMRYYKQSLNPNRALVVHNKGDKKLHKVLATYRALGWTETDQKSAAKKASDIHYMKRMQAKYTMKLGVRANKFQPHFRAQVMF